MTTIHCIWHCQHQKNGICCLENTTFAQVDLQNPCPYFCALPHSASSDTKSQSTPNDFLD